MNLLDLIEKYGMDALNSYTKYPSIQTYHEITGPTLNENLTDMKGFEPEADVYITEKVDGTNSRILTLNGDYMIGSREEFLHRKGDVIYNPSQGIVDVMKPYAEKLVSVLPHDNILRVFYGETYGGNINGAKQYTSHKNTAIRFFDITTIDVTSSDFLNVITMSIDRISSWREHDGQKYVSVSELMKTLEDCGFNTAVNAVPYIRICKGSDIPTVRAETYEWLKEFEKSRAVIDEDYDFDNNKGRAEGVVVRVADRSFIRKIRFEDYERTKRKLGSL